MPGVTSITDDVLAKGTDDRSHDIAVLRLLETARANNLKLNPNKFQFKTQQCRFFGQVLTPEGMSIDPKKVEAIRQMQPPQARKDLESFQGMVKYLKHYSNNLTKLAEPLKELLQNDTLWHWEPRHQRAFDAVKEELTKTPVLAYFNPKADHVIQTDGPMKGLGSELLQNGKPVIYVKDTDTSRRQILQHRA